MPLKVEDIARVCRAKSSNVERSWPLLMDALEAAGIRSELVEVATAATVAIETARTFLPINEFGRDAYFNSHYDTGESAARLGNTPEADGDGALYHGRGFVQLTGRGNYRDASHVAGVDLEVYPEKALDPAISAKLLAWFFTTHRVNEAANTQDWRHVRHLVNGGYNGWAEFLECVNGLLEVPCA